MKTTEVLNSFQIIGFEDAVAEFVDNSIQACQENSSTGSRSINISLSVEKYKQNNKYLGMYVTKKELLV
jgi:hypothetical protein